MKFDKTITEPCIIKLGVDPDCPDDVGGPSVDPDCNDPAYRVAHPEECEGATQLIIKPSVATICAPYGVNFKTFVYANGVEEEVDVGVTYRSSDNNVAIIGGTSGRASGIGGGIATISAEWQNLAAYAQLTVQDSEICCDGTKVGMLLLMDNSESMKRDFGPPNGRRADFMRKVAADFVLTINSQKDVGAVMSFNETGELVFPWSNDLEELRLQANSVTPTGFKTNYADALTDAIDYVNSDTSLTTRVIIMFTDGDDHGEMDPIPIADEFINSGGILVIVGFRAWGVGYDRLVKMASGGYFLNAIPTGLADTTIASNLSGMKGYFCAGNCVPIPTGIINKAKLNYFGFANWTVTGAVDLIGGDPPFNLFDILPGNGLYVDLVGTCQKGKLTSKVPIILDAGTNRLRFKLAGNQRDPGGPYSVRVRLTDVAVSTVFVDQEIVVTDWLQDMETYTFDFVVPAGNTSVIISFETIDVVEDPMQFCGHLPFGLLLDEVRVNYDPEGVNSVVFYDNFDDENPVPPEEFNNLPVCAGSGNYGGYDYCYGYGCLDTPPGPQQPDPNPVEDFLEIS